MPDKINVVEIEIDDARNRCLFFGPLHRRVRGRFDFARCAEPRARLKTSDWPHAIPGAVLGVNLDTGEGFIREPLHDEKHADLRERIERMGYGLPKARESFNGVHVPTWLFWMRRAIESKSATLVQGAIPDDLGGKPQTEFIVRQVDDDRDVLIKQLVAVLYANLSPKQRAEVDAVMG